MQSRVSKPATIFAAIVLGVGSTILIPGVDTRMVIFAIVSTVCLVAVASTALSMAAGGLAISRCGGAVSEVQIARQHGLARRFFLAITIGAVIIVLVGRVTVWAEDRSPTTSGASSGASGG